MMKILQFLLKNKQIVFKAICGLSVALLLVWGIILHNNNKKLSESLKIAKNNVEFYQAVANEKEAQNTVLLFTAEELKNSNDDLLQQLDSVINANKIKINNINTAATQTQIVYVNDSKGVQGDLIEILKDTTYNDSIKYNDLTTVYYTIGRDTVNVGINLQNTQYLTTYKKKQYKNKKNFFKRLITLDFKKEYKYEYKIINTNDLIKTSNVRVVEIIQ